MTKSKLSDVQAVAEFLQEKGFGFGSILGIAIDQVTDQRRLGLFRGEGEQKSIKNLWGRKRPRRPFVGVLWLESEPGQSDLDRKRWLLDCFGKQNVEEFQRLARDLTIQFGHPVLIIRAYDHELTERRSGDPLSTFFT